MNGYVAATSDIGNAALATATRDIDEAGKGYK